MINNRRDTLKYIFSVPLVAASGELFAENLQVGLTNNIKLIYKDLLNKEFVAFYLLGDSTFPCNIPYLIPVCKLDKNETIEEVVIGFVKDTNHKYIKLIYDDKNKIYCMIGYDREEKEIDFVPKTPEIIYI